MNEALIVGALLLVLIGAVAFYLYSRVLFTERKLGLIESLLLDIRMNMEMEEDPHMRHMATAVPAAAPAPVQHESTANTIISDSIDADAEDAETADVYKSVMEEVAAVAPTTTVPSSAVDYDLLSREEVALLAEKRGIRVTKRMAKGTIIALLQEGDKAQPQQGNSDVSGVPMASSAGGAPLDSVSMEEVE